MFSDILHKELGVVILLAARAAQKTAHAAQSLLLSPFGVGQWQANWMKTASPETSPSPGSNLQLLPSQFLWSSPMRNCRPTMYHKVRYRQIRAIDIH